MQRRSLDAVSRFADRAVLALRAASASRPRGGGGGSRQGRDPRPRRQRGAGRQGHRRLGRERRRRTGRRQERRQGALVLRRPGRRRLEASRWRRPGSNPSRKTSWSTAAAPPKRCARPSSRSRRKSSRRRRRRSSRSSTPRSRKGNRLAGAGEYAAARTAYQKALDQVEEPAKKAEILAGIASTYVQEKKPADSVQYLEQALAIDRQERDRAAADGLVLAAQGRDEEAKQYLARLPDEGSVSTPRPSSTSASCATTKASSTRRARSSTGCWRSIPDRAEAYYFSGLVKLNQEQQRSGSRALPEVPRARAAATRRPPRRASS